MKFRSFFLSGALLLSAAFLAAADNAPVIVAEKGKEAKLDVPIDKIKQAEDAVKNKKNVMQEIMRLFLDRNPPTLLSTRAHKELPPQMSVIPGKDGMATLIYRCRYIDPEFITDALETVISDSGDVEVIKKLGSETNEYSQLVIHDKADKMDELKQILMGLDKLQPQVLVEAQIIEIYSEQGAERDVKLMYTYKDAADGTTNKFGFNLDSPSQDQAANKLQGGSFDFVPYSTTSSDGSTGQLNAAVRMLDSTQNARVLSAPNVIADQGEEATITTAEELPIPETAALTSSTNLSFKFKQVGVTLKITPKIISGNTVQLEVSPQVRSVLRYQAFTQDNTVSNIPVISVRSIDTRLTVADGDIIILGGLYNSETTLSLRKVPYIGDIPVVGDLLNGRDSSSVDKQLLFLLKVHVIDPFNQKAVDMEGSASKLHSAAKILENSRKIFTNKPASEFYDVEGELNEEAKNKIEQRQNQRSFMQKMMEFLEDDNPTPEDAKTEGK